jgi:N,N'-diacetyllegionaminate synthase
MTKTLIIAEAGVNHNADLTIAYKLIDVAKEAGVDIVKFQTAVPELVMTKSAGLAEYQKINTGNGTQSQLEMAKQIHFSLEVFEDLFKYARSVGISVLSTPFDHVSIDFLATLNMDIFKIPSGEITNKPYLRHIAKLGKDIILSTGMSNILEIRQALEILESEGVSLDRITVLHCNTEYPTPMGDVNLLAMHHIKQEFGVKVGYSDHTLGIEVPIAAVALGASVIEKHFTLDRTMQGPDHAASLEPEELKSMVLAIRNVEKALNGSGIKEPSVSERKNMVIARRSIHTKRKLKKGHVLNADDLIVLRPGNGISPMKIDEIIGKAISKDLDEQHMLGNNDIE